MPITKKHPLILASKSPRRKQLLAQVGIPFMAFPPDLKEDLLCTDPRSLPVALAELKASHVHKQRPGSWTLGADTVVLIDEMVLGKPASHKDAASMLNLLSGKTHQVITGYCLIDPGGAKRHSEAVVTNVTFKALTEQEISGYIKTGEPFGKAGSYAIQGIGAFLVESVSGSYTNVVGLPLCSLIKAMVSVGALAAFPIL